MGAQQSKLTTQQKEIIALCEKHLRNKVIIDLSVGIGKRKHIQKLFSNKNKGAIK